MNISPCQECSEFYSKDNRLCPICELRVTLRFFQGEFSKPVLEVSDAIASEQLELLGEKVAGIKNQEHSKGKLKSIEEGIEIIRRMLPHVSFLLELEIPDKAIPVGYDDYEDVRLISLSILRIEWENIRYCVQYVCDGLRHRFPELGKIEIFSELFKSGFKQIGKVYQSEYMFSVQSYYRLPIYMQSIGFEKVPEIDIRNVDLEITAGYYSYLRNTKPTSPSSVSLHQVPTDISFNPAWRFRRDKIQFALSEYKSTSDVAHFIGPESDLFAFFKEFLCDEWPIRHGGSITTDVEDAVIVWWTDKSKLSFRPIKPGAIE